MIDGGRCLRVRSFGRVAVVLLAAALSGCIASTRNPERLIPVPVEMEALAVDQSTLIASYNDAIRGNSAGARTIRNEIITRRMYAIDVQYTQYENALTREGQEIGFGALTTATGLSSAATLVAGSTTKSILSAAATGVLATKGHYESEILLAQTIRTIQKQMRASRNAISMNILAKMNQSVADYPLWSALSDVEDYYNAGTLTTGIIDTSTTVGIQEAESRVQKTRVSQVPASVRPSLVLRDLDVPIPPPPRAQPAPDGVKLGTFELGMKDSDIRLFQKFACVAENGRFSKSLRDVIITHLVKIDEKDDRSPDRLTATDGAIIRSELKANRRVCAS